MKRGAPDHWKMESLAKRLKVPSRYALAWSNGVMERLWHYAAKYAIQGDIGRVPNEAIARACSWPERDAKELVDALVAVGFIDSCDTFRLIIHDWPEHCDDSVKKTLKNRGLPFVFPESSGNRRKIPPALAFPKPEPKPEPVNETAPVQSSSIDASSEADFTCDEFEAAWHRHKNFSQKEPMHLVLQNILSMNGKFRVDRFRSNHPGWCEYWEANGWNNFGSLTFLGWIGAGMPEPQKKVPAKRESIIDRSAAYMISGEK